MVANQRIKLGPRHRGKLVTVVIEDTDLRILDGDEDIAVRPAATSPQHLACTSPTQASNPETSNIC